MAKSIKPIKTIIKLQCAAGKANPAPPVGTALGPQGVNIMEFCTKFNEATREMGNTIIPVKITVYEDRTFTFTLNQPPASVLIKEALKLATASANPKKIKVGKLTDEQLTAIAERKMVDLSARDIEQAKKVIAGTARSMGVEVEQA
jgi:large subunit ribosomal protein L11